MNESLKEIIVTKASGEKVPFSVKKLQHSLERSGADDAIIDEVISELSHHLRDGISTKKIYKHAYNILRKISSSHAARYKLKQAIMELGPSGYPFEKFVGEILKFQGFTVKVGAIVEGHCVSHEVDMQRRMKRILWSNVNSIICRESRVMLRSRFTFKPDLRMLKSDGLRCLDMKLNSTRAG
jgi:hypothetical protein